MCCKSIGMHLSTCSTLVVDFIHLIINQSEFIKLVFMEMHDLCCWHSIKLLKIAAILLCPYTCSSGLHINCLVCSGDELSATTLLCNHWHGFGSLEIWGTVTPNQSKITKKTQKLV